jgi:ABC-type uncharacterized transport system permease subunit
MHQEILSALLFRSDRFWIWLAAYVYILASCYSAYSLAVKKFMAPRLTFGLILVGFFCQSMFLFDRGHQIGRCPITNFFELLVFMGWSVVLFYILIGTSFRLSILGVLTAPFVVVICLWALALPDHGPAWGKLPVNPWLEAHTSFSMVACGAFALAGLAGLVYLFQENQLKTRKPSSIVFRLPPIATLTAVSTRLIGLGFVLFTIGLTAGFFIGQEPDWRKVTWSLVVWALYGGILLARIRRTVAGKWIATLSIVAFSLLLSTFWGIRFLSESSSIR